MADIPQRSADEQKAKIGADRQQRRILARVARWYINKKSQILECNALKGVVKFYVHLVYLLPFSTIYGNLVYLMPFSIFHGHLEYAICGHLAYFSRFGML
jgi:hypothetical protein